ncbi:sialidase family protein [Noviherbaspirillum sp. UKPF54]|uniref:sialidase family protein n=1 Tax=Noviherbaspirillum sp. UKPF54 TaxID=2601898 RepID=UPI0011B195E8|nr:sialidase family protein [Noviherbaspirillum sp. UKPF54]QDZ28553.1 exo-alpha-sialidase [Noviherbaspirillum sp. UKPF54]
MNTVHRIFSSGLLALSLVAFGAAAQDPHAQHKAMKSARVELGTSAAVDGQGRLWIATVEAGGQGAAGSYVVLQMSSDMGQTWSPPARAQQAAEPIEAAGESRPKLAFGARNEIYIAYTRPLSKPYTGEIRFIRSIDGGKTFSAPTTVHANRDLITHRFESMIVDRAGRVYIAWIDKRDSTAARARNEKYAGAAIYYAVSDDGGASFRGDYKLADHSCECCRIALALDPQGSAVAMWRHVFEPNVRDHALAGLRPDGKPVAASRVTFDDWQVDACPHHGPGLAFGPDGTRHQVWFDVKDDEGGLFYAASDAAGSLGKPVRLGAAQAEHADVAAQGNNVVLAWKQFDGKETAILSRVSGDAGRSWQERELARTGGASDQPRLVNTPSGIVLVWRTRDDGVRVVPADRR